MYIHLGQFTVVRLRDVVGIFDIENASVSKSTRQYLASAQKRGWVVNVSQDIPKSFVVCTDGKGGGIRVYITQISSVTLKKRTRFLEDLSGNRLDRAGPASGGQKNRRRGGTA